MSAQSLILRNNQSPGDIVMLTAAVRDLHRSYPGRFRTAVDTSCPALWENNPLVCGAEELGPQAQVVDCEYPLIHRSNQEPVHFTHGFIDFLNRELGLLIELSELRGDVYISSEEQAAGSPLNRIVKGSFPYWLVVAGGKYDFTIKWWDFRRYQAVVDHFHGRLLFVQTGETGHYHPRLNSVVDLRGKTSLREFVRLMYFAEGVLCPVTFVMHLAEALPPLPGGRRRAAVIVAGGREPVAWEAYPGHDFLHTLGHLDCCRSGGCWRSRTLPLGDADEKDRSLCVDVSVAGLPRCMDLITAETVIERINAHVEAGEVSTLTAAEAEHLSHYLTRDEWAEFEAEYNDERK